MLVLLQLPCTCGAVFDCSTGFYLSFSSRLEVDLPGHAFSGALCLYFSTQMGLTMGLPQLPCARDAAHGGSLYTLCVSLVEVGPPGVVASVASCLCFPTTTGLMTFLPQLLYARVAARGGSSCASFERRLKVDLPSDALPGASCLGFSASLGSMADLPQLPGACVISHCASSYASLSSRLESDLSGGALVRPSCIRLSTWMGSMADLPQLPSTCVVDHGGSSCASFSSRFGVDPPSDALSGASNLGFAASPPWHSEVRSAFESVGVVAEICVFVRCPRRTVHVMVSPGATVGDLGLALYDAEGIPPRFQALRHASTLLDLLRPLTSYGIGDGSFLDLGGTSVLGGVSPVSPALGVLGRRRSTRIAAAVTTSPCPPVPHPTPQDAARTASPGSVLPPPLPTAVSVRLRV